MFYLARHRADFPNEAAVLPEVSCGKILYRFPFRLEAQKGSIAREDSSYSEVYILFKMLQFIEARENSNQRRAELQAQRQRYISGRVSIKDARHVGRFIHDFGVFGNVHYPTSPKYFE